MWRGKSSYAITMSVQVVGAWSKNCRVIELSSILSKTVELSNYRAKLSNYRVMF